MKPSITDEESKNRLPPRPTSYFDALPTNTRIEVFHNCDSVMQRLASRPEKAPCGLGFWGLKRPQRGKIGKGI